MVEIKWKYKTRGMKRGIKERLMELSISWL